MRFGEPIVENIKFEGINCLIMVIGKHQMAPSTNKLYEATLVVCEYAEAPPEFIKNRYTEEMAHKIYNQYKLKQANIKKLIERI